MKSALSVLLLCFLLVSCGEEKSVEAELIETEKTIQERAEAGDAEAQSNLGVMYEKGEGVPKDYVEAVKWYRKAAEQGDAYGQKQLVKWYRKAAEQGVAIAQVNLGWMYDNGEGVPKDSSEATKWYRKAAKQGNADAKEWLKKNAKDKSE